MWQLTYTLYAAFNLLLVSLGFGNPHITTQDPGFIADAATVCCHPLAIYCLLLVYFIEKHRDQSAIAATRTNS